MALSMKWNILGYFNMTTFDKKQLNYYCGNLTIYNYLLHSTSSLVIFYS